MRIALAILLCVSSVNAATLYCGPTSSGSASGADFNNLIALPDTTGFTRGNVYVLVDGSGSAYSSKSLTTAVSGTTLITIRKANAAQDSGVAGYSSGLHDGQATLTFNSPAVSTDYWLIDGITRNSADWSDPVYGIRITSQIHQRNYMGEVGGDHVTFRYCDIGGTHSTTFSESHPDVGFYFGGFDSYFSDWTISYSFVHNVDLPFQIAGGDDIVIEYTMIGPSWQKESVRGLGHAPGTIVRYCIFTNSCQAVVGDPPDGRVSCTAVLALWGGDVLGDFDDIQIYGNLIYQNHSANHSDACIMVGGDDNVTAYGVTARNCLVYNNTIIGIQVGQATIRKNGNGTGNIARNNIWSNLGGGVSTGTSFDTASNNEVLATSVFVNFAGGNFKLDAAQAGTSIGSPFNLDMFGETRGADGTFDIGFAEFDDGTPDASPPVLTSATIGTSGTTLTLAFDEVVEFGAGGNAGWTFTMSGGAVTASYASGETSSVLVYNLSRTVNSGETTTAGLDYTQPGNGVEDTTGNDLVSIDDDTITNNSTQGGGGGGVASGGTVRAYNANVQNFTDR